MLVSAGVRIASPVGSVVICTSGHKVGSLRRCLDSLKSQSENDIEVVLVTREELPSDLKAMTSRVILERRKGISLARNLGIAQTKCPLVAFTDDDCVCHPEWVSNIFSPFADARIGVVTGRVLSLGSGKVLAAREDVTPETFDRPAASYWRMGGGNNMAARREVLTRAGGFDVSLTTAEDMDMFYKTTLQGNLLRYQPEAIIYHEKADTKTAFLKECYYYRRGEGELYSKYRKRITNFNPVGSLKNRDKDLIKHGVKGLTHLNLPAAAEGFLSAAALTLAFCSYDFRASRRH